MLRSTDIKSCFVAMPGDGPDPMPQLPLSFTDTVNENSSTMVAKNATGSEVTPDVASTLKTKDPLLLLTTWVKSVLDAIVGRKKLSCEVNFKLVEASAHGSVEDVTAHLDTESAEERRVCFEVRCHIRPIFGANCRGNLRFLAIV